MAALEIQIWTFYSGFLQWQCEEWCQLFDDRFRRSINEQEESLVIGTAAVTSVNFIQNDGFTQMVSVLGTSWWSNKLWWLLQYHYVICCRFPDGSLPTRKGLVVAIVCSANTQVNYDLVNALLPNQTQAYEKSFFIYNEDETLSRCQCCQANNTSDFR